MDSPIDTNENEEKAAEFFAPPQIEAAESEDGAKAKKEEEEKQAGKETPHSNAWFWNAFGQKHQMKLSSMFICII